jgi:hypothetical protein
MSIFKEMYDGRHFASVRDYTELRRKAISRGYVEQIPCTKIIVCSDEEWYRDKVTGEVYCLDAPGEQSWGWWARIDPEDFRELSKAVE